MVPDAETAGWTMWRFRLLSYDTLDKSRALMLIMKVQVLWVEMDRGVRKCH